MSARPSVAASRASGGFRAVCAVAAMTIAAASPARAADPSGGLRGHFERLVREAEAARMRPRAPLPPRPLEPTGDYDLISADLDIAVDPTGGSVDSTTTLELRSQVPSLSRIELIVMRALDVLSVTDAGGDLEFSYTPGDYMLFVTPRSPVSLGGSVTLTVLMSGYPSCDGSCGVGGEITFLGLMDVMPADVDALDGMWDDQFTSTYRIVAPSGYVLVASGELLSEEALPGGSTARRYEQVHAGLYGGFAMARYSLATAADPVPLTVALLPGHDAYGATFLDIMRDALGIYSSAWGEYLYTKLGMAEVPPSDYFAAMGLEALVWYVEPDAADPALPFGSMTLAHEVGHQWWANMMPVGEPIAPWLAEGFAEFSAMLHVERTEGPPVAYAPWEEVALRALHGDLYVYMPLYTADDTPLTSDDLWSIETTAYVIVTYYKGAMVVEAMRSLLGDDAFFPAMRDYVADHREDPVWTDDLREALEAAWGGSLERFFDAWVYGTGYPSYTIDVSPGADGLAITLTLDDGRFAEMPVRVRVFDLPGGSVDLDTTIGPSGRTTVTVDVANGPPFLEIDPLYTFPRRVASGVDGDVAISGEVDGFDLVAVAWSRGAAIWDQAMGWNALADLDSDGSVGDADVDRVLSRFGL